MNEVMETVIVDGVREITKEERVGELYRALANPMLPADLSRQYMHEFTELTGMGKESGIGQIMFLNENSKVETTTVDNLISMGYKIMLVIGVAMIVIPIGQLVLMEIKRQRNLRLNAVEKRLKWLTNKNRIKNYTDEEFNTAMVEIAALVDGVITDPYPPYGPPAPFLIPD